VTESKLKKTSLPENVILGDVRDVTKDGDAVLEEAAPTTATCRWMAYLGKYSAATCFFATFRGH